MLDGLEVKFLGTVQSYNEAKKFGTVVCEEAHKLWGQDTYAYKDVLATVEAGVGDMIRYGIHVSPRGQPQVSLPVYKVGEDGLPIGVPPGAEFINVEDAAREDPGFLDKLKEEVDRMSDRHNNRKRTRPPGPDSRGDMRSIRPRGAPPALPGPEDWGRGRSPADWRHPPRGGNDWDRGRGHDHDWREPPRGSYGGGQPWGPGHQEASVSLFVSGVPRGVPRRELLHIFRQYAGFMTLRQIEREDHSLVFIDFATPAQADFVVDALHGYIFDEEVPPEEQTPLTLQHAKQRLRG